MAWLQANWLQLLVVLLTVDQVLIGIFPKVALLGSIADVIKAIVGNKAPPVP